MRQDEEIEAELLRRGISDPAERNAILRIIKEKVTT